MIKKVVAIIISTVLVMTMMPSMVFADTLEEEKVGAGESYGIYIGGTEITSENKNNITGKGIEGEISYDDEKSVLTLNNATITGKTKVGDKYTGIDYGLVSNQDLTVELIGTN